MARNISFMLTTPQFIARTKFVTRRLGWLHVKAGDILCGVEKGQGIPKGGTVNKLGMIRVEDARQEPVKRLTDDPEYGAAEVILEGFPDMTPAEFVTFFCKANRPCEPAWNVTRIKFGYL